MTLDKELLTNPDRFSFAIESVGECKIPSPVKNKRFVPDDERILYCYEEKALRRMVEQKQTVPSCERSGPRETVFHDPAWSRAAIVTCGGLCPGLNDVIKGIVNTLHFDYGVKNIYGIRYGYRGFCPKHGHAPLQLDPDIVDKIHEEGGTILGTSRGKKDTGVICDTLQRMNINMLFTIGGDGTLRGAHDIADELQRRGEKISVIGVPKTIDNDLSFVGRSFGFETSVYSTTDTLTAAHTEAKGALNGIGLVKLMGRDSGFIAAYASLANSVVNFCLIPEESFTLEGPNGLLQALEQRFRAGKDHAVIVVAEGAGQELFEDEPVRKDASGNILKNDIGELLKRRITQHFTGIDMPCSVKYFDPSYSIRGVPAFGADAIFCYSLAENAVHAAMAGRTDMVVGTVGAEFTNIPIALATMERQKVDTEGTLWNMVLSSTRQNDYLYPDA